MTAEFDRAMRQLYTEVLEQIRVSSGVFLADDQRVGRARAKALLAPCRPTHVSFTTLYPHSRLDLTVEATVLATPAFSELFTEDELDTARERPALHGYRSPS